MHIFYFMGSLQRSTEKTADFCEIVWLVGKISAHCSSCFLSSASLYPKHCFLNLTTYWTVSTVYNLHSPCDFTVLHWCLLYYAGAFGDAWIHIIRWTNVCLPSPSTNMISGLFWGHQSSRTYCYPQVKSCEPSWLWSRLEIVLVAGRTRVLKIDGSQTVGRRARKWSCLQACW